MQAQKKGVVVATAAAMRLMGGRVARSITTEAPGERARVVALCGDLGAGKTTFTQGFLKQIGVKRRIISPTFLIIRPYKIKAKNFNRAFHIDCYRLNKASEIINLGLKEILKDPKHIVLIEWPELVKKYLPKEARWIKIGHPEKGTQRKVSVS